MYRRNVQKVLQKVEGKEFKQNNSLSHEGKESCMRSHWLVVRPSRHAQTQGTGSKDSLSPVCLAGWSSDIHIVVSVQRPDSSEAMGVPVHILLKKPARGLLHIC